MKSNIYTTFPAIALAILLAACSAATPENDKKTRLEKLKTEQANLGQEIKKLEEEISKTNPEAKTVKAKDVEVLEVKAMPFNHYVQTQGAVEAEDNILVSSKTMGVVTGVYVTEGQSVSKGQAIAQIDNSALVRTSESMKSQLELATAIFQRQQNLWDQKIGTEVQYLQAKTSKESLEKQLASMHEQIDMTRIKSPISGTVDEVMAKIGENLSPGVPAARVVNTSNLKIKASVSESYVSTIKKGDKVLVIIDDLGKDLEAKVTFVGKNIDLLTRTFGVEVKLPSLPNLRPNMTAVVKIIFHTEPAALLVPVNVVQEINGEKVVFVAQTEGNKTIVKRKVVKIGGVYDNMAEVRKGLSAGEKIVTVGYQSLNDGEIVKI
ncbi:MAG TPA: efflux RND transporter periplasmic adaptor subunit [Chryseolinea sp.]|nr:efflux RND transporter periplasmic adaptor subunit [Chryseolinea sp.]